MQIEFETDQKKSTPPIQSHTHNFVAQLILQTRLVRDPKKANSLSVLLAIMLLVWCLVSIWSFASPKEIDSKYYFDPATAAPDAR